MPELTVSEIVQKVRRIQIVARHAVDDLFAGEYHSAFRGRGMEFDEVREYQPGDDVRSIDWNVTARAGTPFLKSYREERELTVLFLADVSASGMFGSLERSRLDCLVEVAALLMYSALRNNDKVGLVLFSDEVHRYLPARKGRTSVLRLLRELVAVEPVARPTRIDRVLEFLARVQRRRAVVFLLSDFLAEGFARPLAMVARRHDLVAVRFADRRERELPAAGLLDLHDPETGEVVEVDASDPRVREWVRQQGRRREHGFQQIFRRAGVDELVLDTSGEHEKHLWAFFRRRERVAHRGGGR